MRILSGDWGFDLSEIRCSITLWHGKNDMSAPAAMTKRTHELLRNCTATFFPDESHMSVMQLHAAEILKAV